MTRRLLYSILTVAFAVMVSPLPAAGQSILSCVDFPNQATAQTFFDAYPTELDDLDANGNGIACDEEPADAPVPNDGADTESTRPPLDARLGGTVGSWEAEFGPPTEIGPFTAYDIDGFRTVFIEEHLGYITRITLSSPRPANEEGSMDDLHLDWTVEEAHEIAQRFLPRDVELEEPDEARVGVIMTECASDALATTVPAAVYVFFDNPPTYGGCNYRLMLRDEDESRVNGIVVQLHIDERFSGANAPTGNDSGDAAEPLTPDELAYMATMNEKIVEIIETINTFNEIAASPESGSSAVWSRLDAVFDGWQSTYIEVQEMTPPPAFSEVHAAFVEALRLLSAAADDIRVGFDTSDMARFERGLQNIPIAADWLREANRLLELLLEERGV